MPKTKDGGFILDDGELAPYGKSKKKKVVDRNLQFDDSVTPAIPEEKQEKTLK